MTAERMAGRELDAEIAEKVFGATGRMTVFASADRKLRSKPLVAFTKDWNSKGLTVAFGSYFDEQGNKLPFGIGLAKPMSEDIADAWLVVEALTSKGHDVVIRPNGIAYEGVAHVEVGLCVDGGYSSDAEFDADASTVPLAICLAALAALESAHP